MRAHLELSALPRSTGRHRRGTRPLQAVSRSRGDCVPRKQRKKRAICSCRSRYARFARKPKHIVSSATARRSECRAFRSRAHRRLTGLANRRYLDAHFRPHCSRAPRCATQPQHGARRHRPLQGINDRFSHVVGDESCVRWDDLARSMPALRYGGPLRRRGVRAHASGYHVGAAHAGVSAAARRGRRLPWGKYMPGLRSPSASASPTTRMRRAAAMLS